MRRRKNSTEMKFTVLSIFLLACLFVITVKGTSARVVSGAQERIKNKLEVTEIKVISAKKESPERSGAGHMRKLGFGRTVHHEETSVDSENGKGTPKISGKEENDLKETFGNYQVQKKNDHQNTKCSQHCEAVSGKGKLERSSRTEQQIFEAQSPIDAAK